LMCINGGSGADDMLARQVNDGVIGRLTGSLIEMSDND